MHESGVIQDLIRQIERIAEAEAESGGRTRISRIGVAVGESAGFEPGHLEFHFQVAAKGTVAEGSVLDITCQPGREIKLISLELEGAGPEDLVKAPSD